MLWFTLLISTTFGSPLDFTDKVPLEIKNEFQADLAHLKQIKGGKASALNRQIFGGETVDGQSYFNFFTERVAHIDLHPSQKDFFVTAGGATTPLTLFVSPEYIRYRKTL